MFFSIVLIATGGSLIPSTQAASQGAGHIRPVNSGKLLVACNWRIASCQRSRYTKSFQSGIMLLTGQPVWQNGKPQSMQRAACVEHAADAIGLMNSFHVALRFSTFS